MERHRLRDGASKSPRPRSGLSLLRFYRLEQAPGERPLPVLAPVLRYIDAVQLEKATAPIPGRRVMVADSCKLRYLLPTVGFHQRRMVLCAARLSLAERTATD